MVFEVLESAVRRMFAMQRAPQKGGSEQFAQGIAPSFSVRAAILYHTLRAALYPPHRNQARQLSTMTKCEIQVLRKAI